jgi:hypothetical protein
VAPHREHPVRHPGGAKAARRRGGHVHPRRGVHPRGRDRGRGAVAW